MNTELEKLRQEVKALRKKTDSAVPLPKADSIYEGMSVEEYRELTLLYGENIKQITECSSGMVHKLHYIQSTVKIMHNLDFEKLKNQYEKLTDSYSCMRLSYFTAKQKKCYRILLKDQSSAMRFYDLSAHTREEALSGVQEGIYADRRKGFRLERDPLVRIIVFKISKDLNYVLISQVCEDDGSERINIIIHKLFGQYLVYRDEKAAQPVKSFSVAESWYWKNYLQDLGKRQFVPGYIENDEIYSKGVCRLITSEQLFEALGALAKRCSVTVNDIMEAAWAILLHRFYQEEDILFGVTGDHSGSGIVPIRAVISDKEKCCLALTNISARNQGMIIYGNKPLAQIEQELSLREPLINHLLSFSNMSRMEETKPAKIEKDKVLIATYAEERWDFCLHIRIVSGKVAFNCIYNQNCYEAEAIQAVLDTYAELLEQMTEDEQKLIGEYHMNGFARIQDHSEEKEKLYLERVLTLSQHPVFSKLPAEELEKLALAARTLQCAQYDQLLTEGETIETAAFIVEGNVRMSKAGKDGCERPILLLNKGQMLTGQWILEDCHSSFTMMADSMDTVLMLIPIPIMLSVMSRYPEIARAFFRMEHERYLRVVQLWMNAD